MTEKRDLGQVWTPETTVEHMLNLANYTGQTALNSTILEPGFGNGAFLEKIIERIISAGKEAQLNNTQIATIINNNVHGVELDEETFKQTVKKLQKICQKQGIITTFSNLKNMDAIDYEKTVNKQFDIVIGNPPYIRVHDMTAKTRQKVKQYHTATGNTDLYIIFYEIGLNLLKTDGTLIFITPNSWTKNSSQKSFRKLLFDNKLVTYIEDYGSLEVFKNASTYVSIMKLQKTEKDTFTIAEVEKGTQQQFNYCDIKDTSASLASLHDTRTGTPLGSLCSVQNGIVTMKDSVYLSDTDYDSSIFVRPCVKASTYKGGPINRYIIFPYLESENTVKGVSEKELQKDINVYNHLLKNKESLTARSIDNKSLWFWYGRSQAIKKINCKKLVVSTLISPDQTSVNCYQVPEGTVVYSGIFISEIPSGGLSLEEVASILRSSDFINYCRLFGVNKRGGYHAISTPIIKSFMVSNILD